MSSERRPARSTRLAARSRYRHHAPIVGGPGAGRATVRSPIPCATGAPARRSYRQRAVTGVGEVRWHGRRRRTRPDRRRRPCLDGSVRPLPPWRRGAARTRRPSSTRARRPSRSAARDPPDCAILDFQLPDISGLELLGRLGDGSGTVPFAVVMVSAHASTELATAALSAGALDCLDKTKVTEAGLRRAVRTALDRNRLRAQIEAQRLEVAEQARRTRQILQRITDGFFAIDSAWRFTFVNPVAEQTFGRDRGSLLGARLPDLFPELVDSKLYDGLARALEMRRADLVRDGVRARPKLAGAARLPGRRRALGLLPRRDGPQAGRDRARAPARARRDAPARRPRVRRRGRSPAAGRLDRRGGDAAARRRSGGGRALGPARRDAAADRDQGGGRGRRGRARAGRLVDRAGRPAPAAGRRQPPGGRLGREAPAPRRPASTPRSRRRCWTRRRCSAPSR